MIMSNETIAGCAAPQQDRAMPATVNLDTAIVLSGHVLTDDGTPVVGAYVRLLDRSGEFTAEVVTGEGGIFRFFAAEGSWTIRALSREGDGEISVAALPGLNDATVSVSR